MIRRIKGAKYLTKPTQPLNVDRDRSVPGMLEKMEHISFQGRNLAIAHQLWLQMLSENSVVGDTFISRPVRSTSSVRYHVQWGGRACIKCA